MALDKEEKTILGISVGAAGLVMTSLVAGISYAYGSHLVDSGQIRLPGGPRPGKTCPAHCVPRKARKK